MVCSERYNITFDRLSVYAQSREDDVAEICDEGAQDSRNDFPHIAKSKMRSVALARLRYLSEHRRSQC
ncbi:hypothetical protein AA0242T_1822 [Acetobacter aceti NRIC 0242]|uniref:Transposase n=1 Tax=Acetobacter aceti NBRC 14818 TaxID=887700 RepID=A0AB33IF31_ACEAC|nr:hypothetical protein EMQ_1305 [Acetobacter aceti NBRC 14818]GAN57878.1 hypothetical protein Abac_022_011 [Acetobacter aceti NBRC 14818]GBO81120.1 hypothetical protein AA0242T_1822 [Acetobacter aceti NRIC 0242]